MAHKIMGSADLTATTNTTVYTVPASRSAVVNVNICNRGSSNAKARLALAASDTPTDAEWVEYDVDIPPSGVLERTAFALDAGKRVVAYASAADVTVMVYGSEE